MGGLTLLLSALAAGAIAWAGTGLILRLLQRRAILDVPNPRSSHSQPTPRGGGIAVVGSIAIVWIAWWLLDLSAGAWWPIFAATAVLALVSWADDLRGMPVGLRLATHLACVVAGVSLLPENQMVLQGVVPWWLDRLVAVVAWLWFVNLYNFMDGIDGITSVETIAIGGGLILVSVVGGWEYPAGALALVIAAAAAGFLPWNWNPARIFLGDVGSVALGYLCGWLLLVAAAQGWWSVALILPLYYLADATITLAAQVLRRERIWQAHATHFYQRAARRAASHGRISLVIATTNALLVVAAVAAVNLVAAWIAVIFSAAIVAVLLWYLARGLARSSHNKLDPKQP